MNSSNNYVFIMAGGVGSRFWPKSRNSFPKQFIDILGVGKSLLQITYSRFRKLCPVDNIYIVTNEMYRNLVQTQLAEINEDNILCEPSRNNTAPCIAYAAFKLASKNPQANMVVAPSDHFILYEDIFLNKIAQALNAASEHEVLVTLGITPTRPDTGYGYINFDQMVQQSIYKVKRFTEKPSLDKAVEFIAEGNYVWNAGIFVWNVSTILKAFRKYTPDIAGLFEKGQNIYNTSKEQAFIDRYYPETPNISIDYAIMEKADNVYTIPADFGWSDLGTWASLFEVVANDNNSNALSNSTLLLEDTENCIIHLPTEKLAVIRGLKDYIVVEDNNVLLIYPKDKEQEIKKVTEKLKTNGHSCYL
ncbi:NTP transferase domain-containing protein [Chitinophaga polysaccharea]|uniref:mannose-1-phosphate guanylyltransferase n=1 Tax=Chitinophaga polysaccharea TaxID=1293035 RepID=UPI0014559411|nr:mannose-1-phosphate guanylyltransferase [Chitinophaga polysaccharea]NLR61870.1 NTP transferase domain-containing protein [Chitinophaga polysaccharea]